MSKAAGEKYLNSLLTKLLEKNKVYQTLKKEFRAMLDTSIHVLDISEESLSSNLPYIKDADKAEYSESYSKFIRILSSTVQVFETEKSFYNAVRNTSLIKVLRGTTGGVYIADKKILVTTNFGNARAIITKASTSAELKFDRYFGIVNRARSLDELQFQGYEIGDNVASIEDQEAGISAHRCRPPGNTSSKSAKLRYFNSDGLEIDPSDRALIKRELSIFDIGHIFQGSANKGRQSPLSAKLDSALKIRSSPGMKGLLSSALENLANIQAEVTYSYENTIPSKLLDGKGVIVLSLHVYNRNNEYARQEGALYSKLIADMKDELISSLTPAQLAKIPGSNTFIEDTVVVVSNKVISAITKGKGKLKDLPKHALVTGKAVSKQPKQSAKVTSNAVQLPNKISSGTKNTQEQTYSLTGLQSLINRHLQDVISANMGDGNSKNVLNYRTGRLAASAKVERMTQSREGMITAFYSYMKNPYATFSEGGQQQFPRSRDPKLLISKSIREIAAEKVANRMRAVAV